MHALQRLARVHSADIIRRLPIGFVLSLKVLSAFVLRIEIERFGSNGSGKSVRVRFDGSDVFVAGFEESRLH